MRRLIGLIAVLVLGMPILTLAAKPDYEISGKIVKIADGDTLTILDRANTQHKIRLAGIDAPEKGQSRIISMLMNRSPR